MCNSFTYIRKCVCDRTGAVGHAARSDLVLRHLHHHTHILLCTCHLQVAAISRCFGPRMSVLTAAAASQESPSCAADSGGTPMDHATPHMLQDIHEERSECECHKLRLCVCAGLVARSLSYASPTGCARALLQRPPARSPAAAAAASPSSPTPSSSSSSSSSVTPPAATSECV